VEQYAYLIPLFPLAAAVLIGLLGAKVLKGFSHVPAILAMVASLVVALGVLAAFSGAHGAAAYKHDYFNWIAAGKFLATAGIFVDQLSALYVSFVTGIGLLIFIYASGYMKGDYGYFRFFAYLALFVFFMTVLVLGNNFILLYLGWEGVGLASYLLIGYYYPRPSAVAAAKKAFITNRVGDFGFALGIFLIYLTFGSVDYQTVFSSIPSHTGSTALYWIPFLLMVGAFGKSAQFPLHVWLPDAMEGPTPVSALIHAATMVTAGIYMIARCTPLFMASPDALAVVAIVGGFTAFLAATIALCQYDLKRIWAYSTVSQLGYMFLGLGVSAGSAAVFHVFTHAFFKALLFLSAGSVMHAMGGELDIRKMSGVRKVMPITVWTMLFGCLALAGVPPFAGFFSKDEIIAETFNSHVSFHGVPLNLILGGLALLVALTTAYYTFRLFFRVFMGPTELPATAGHHEASPFALPDDHGHGADHGAAAHGAADHGADNHGHDHGAQAPSDGPASMWLPLIVLSLGAMLTGFLGTGAHGGWIHQLLDPVFAPGHYAVVNPLVPPVEAHALEGHESEAAEVVSHTAMMGISFVIALAGIGIAYYFHWRNRAAATALAAKLKPLVTFLENKWYIDEIYQALLLKPLWILGHLCNIVDRFIVDGLVTVVGFVPQLMGYTLKPTQRGLLQRYATGMIAGIAALVIGVVLIVLK